MDGPPCLNCRLYSVECKNTKLSKQRIVNSKDYPPGKRRKISGQTPLGDLTEKQSEGEGEGDSTLENIAAVSALQRLPPAMPASQPQSPPQLQIALPGSLPPSIPSSSWPPSQPPQAPMLSQLPVHEFTNTDIGTSSYDHLILQLTSWETSLSRMTYVKFLTRLKTT